MSDVLMRFTASAIAHTRNRSNATARRRTIRRVRIPVRKCTNVEECDVYRCYLCKIAATSMHMCPYTGSIQLFCNACLRRHQAYDPCTLSNSSTPRQSATLANQNDTIYHVLSRYENGLIIDQEECQEHEIVAPFYCRYCMKYRCIKCAKDKCFECFRKNTMDYFIERDKQSILENYEKASTKFSIIEKCNHIIRTEFDQIQNTTLLRRERIRQEFVSFHDLLIEQEHDMLQHLDQGEREKMDTINNLQANLATLELDNANLTTMVTDLVQTEYNLPSSVATSGSDYIKFRLDCESLNTECSKAEQLVTDFQKIWARDWGYKSKPVLDRPFSMFEEKMRVSEKLDATIDTECRVKFKQSTLTLHDDELHRQIGTFSWTKKIYINEYIHVPVTPTSTKLKYRLKLTTGRTVLYETETEDLKAVYLNSSPSYEFKPGDCCVLQLTPMLIYQTSAASHVTHTETPTHMLIVVDHR